MKNIYEVENIINNMDEATFEKITKLLDSYYASCASGSAEEQLEEILTSYGLTVEEITMWDAQ